jgi:ABC-type nitrate/sulfonate/bicarbonate transport system substrate-binding protein
MQRRCSVCGALAFSIVSLMLTLRPAMALDKIKVGVPSTEAFSFMAVDFGNDLGLYAQNGIVIEKVVLLGSGKLHQGMIAGAVDIAVGAGTDFAFLVKGAPEIGVAAMAGPPLLLGITCRMIRRRKSPTISKASSSARRRTVRSPIGLRIDWL